MVCLWQALSIQYTCLMLGPKAIAPGAKGIAGVLPARAAVRPRTDA